MDAANDVVEGLLVRAPLADPLDILSIRYGNTTNGTDKVISATMKLSTLANIVPGCVWRMDFTANAPFGEINGTNLYSNALCDRGDKLYLKATSNTDGTFSYTYGTVVRTSSGSLTSTSVGNADSGVVNTTNNTITITISASKLNALVTHGPAIAAGTVLSGLRGSASGPETSDARYDATYGGTEYTIQ